MLDSHEILCPNFIQCDICQRIKKNQKITQIQNFSGNLDFNEISNKHFYLLEIILQPTRETYFRFSLNPLKKAGRELINGLSSISGISNRKWWSLYVNSGIKYYSVSQPDKDDYPIFKLNFLMYSSKDNLESRTQTQLKCRLNKIHKELSYKYTYLGQFDLEKIMENVDPSINYDIESAPVKKLDEYLIRDINYLHDNRPVVFGRQYSKKITNKQLETINYE
jgi:hypothetical protein